MGISKQKKREVKHADREKTHSKTQRDKKKRDTNRDREQQAEEEHTTSALDWDFINPFLL